MTTDTTATTPGSDFIRSMVEADLAAGKHARVRTRFPPEPNGYLHIGHAKSICLNFGLADEYPGGQCNLRFDDSNPLTEDMEYVQAIQRDVRWLGFDWGNRLYYASDYFERLYAYAEELVGKGLAYVDSQSEEEIRATRGTVTEAGTESPFRGRSVEESLDLFRRMRGGEFPDGAHVLRARIDMTHPNMKMRDPILYRIRHATHYRRGDEWCIYPMYDFIHCLSDSIEGITHSLCTLEFENNREIYDWILDHLDIPQPAPRQTEFARLNLSYTVLSKRKLLELVEDAHVAGWDDPRMPTLTGLRRRGYTPEAIRGLCDRVGVAKANSTVDVALLEHSIRDDLNHKAPRVLCVLRPLKVVVESWPAGEVEWLEAPYWPHDVPRDGSRTLPFSRELYIDRDDFAEQPPPGFHRLAPGREVRLRYGYVIRCVGVVKDEGGDVVAVRCTHDPATVGGDTPDGRRVRGTIHWVSADHAVPVEVRLYDRLFRDERPDRGKGGPDFKEFLNPDSLEVIPEARAEPSLAEAEPESRFQFERLGFFYLEPEGSGERRRPVFNRVVTLRDTWARIQERRTAGVEALAAPRPRQGAEPAEVAIATDPYAGVDGARRARMRRYEAELGMPAADARTLTEQPAVADFFEAAAAGHANPLGVANWVLHELLRELKTQTLEELSVAAVDLAELVSLVDEGTITSAAAKEVFTAMVAGQGRPREIVAARGLEQLAAERLGPILDEVLAADADNVRLYREGKTALFGHFVGQIMRRTRGRANPRQLQELLRQKLAGDP